MSTTLLQFLVASATATLSLAQSPPTLPPPGQPAHPGVAGAFELIGNSLVSAQQLFLGTEKNVYLVDKVEGNPTKIDGHPAWASGVLHNLRMKALHSNLGYRMDTRR
jgi:hypothetical protein